MHWKPRAACRPALLILLSVGGNVSPTATQKGPESWTPRLELPVGDPGPRAPKQQPQKSHLPLGVGLSPHLAPVSPLPSVPHTAGLGCVTWASVFAILNLTPPVCTETARKPVPGWSWGGGARTWRRSQDQGEEPGPGGGARLEGGEPGPGSGARTRGRGRTRGSSQALR